MILFCQGLLHHAAALAARLHVQVYVLCAIGISLLSASPLLTKSTAREKPACQILCRI